MQFNLQGYGKRHAAIEKQRAKKEVTITNGHRLNALIQHCKVSSFLLFWCPRAAFTPRPDSRVLARRLQNRWANLPHVSAALLFPRDLGTTFTTAKTWATKIHGCRQAGGGREGESWEITHTRSRAHSVAGGCGTNDQGRARRIWTTLAHRGRVFRSGSSCHISIVACPGQTPLFSSEILFLFLFLNYSVSIFCMRL